MGWNVQIFTTIQTLQAYNNITEYRTDLSLFAYIIHGKENEKIVLNFLHVSVISIAGEARQTPKPVIKC
jgi:hypothetical protein